MATSGVKERPSPRAQSRDGPSEDAIKDENGEDNAPMSKPSIISRLWVKSKLNLGMLMMMVKGALPPTISLAIYESTSVAEIYSTLGYLVAIMSVLSFAILPRSKFIQTMLLNIIGVCVGAAVALLEIYCSVQARVHTTPAPSPSSKGPSPGAAVSQYNSSASAVCAIWLFFNIYLVNTLRASRPQLQFPAIMYSIFANVASVYAPSFPNMAAGTSFAKQLLEVFLTGFAIATGVSLIIFPTTVRMTFFKQSAGFIQLVQGTLKAQIAYFLSLEKADMFARPSEAEREEHPSQKKTRAAKPVLSPETQNLKTAITGLEELQGKIYADLAFAKREMAWGKLDAGDISEMLKAMQGILIPLTGMSSAADIFGRIAEKWGWTEEDATIEPSKKEEAQEHKSQWNEIMKSLHDPFEAVTNKMNAGLQHTLYTLELAKPPKTQKEKGGRNSKKSIEDVEAEAGIVEPGDPGYGKYLEQNLNEFYEKRKSTLAVYCRQKGIQMDDNATKKIAAMKSKLHLQCEAQDDQTHQRNKRQLYLVLYVSDLPLVSMFISIRTTCSLGAGVYVSLC